MDLKTYLENIEGHELKTASRALFARNAHVFHKYLPIEPLTDAAVVLFREFEHLPFVLINKVLKYKDELFEEEITLGTPNLEIIRSILRFSSDYRSPLPPTLLEKALDVTLLPQSIRLDMAIYLSVQVSYPTYNLVKRLEENPWILPAVLSKLEYDGKPFEALTYLDRYIGYADLSYVVPFVAELLSVLLDTKIYNREAYRKVSEFINNCQPDTKGLLDQITGHASFGTIQYRLNLLKKEPLPMYAPVFLPSDLDAAHHMLNALDSGHPTYVNPSLNLHALSFALAGWLAGKEDKHFSHFSPIFIAFDKRYRGLFHQSLSAYGLSYDPTEHTVDNGQKSVVLDYDQKKFEDDMRRAGARGDSRVSEMQKILIL